MGRFRIRMRQLTLLGSASCRTAIIERSTYVALQRESRRRGLWCSLYARVQKFGLAIWTGI